MIGDELGEIGDWLGMLGISFGLVGKMENDGEDWGLVEKIGEDLGMFLIGEMHGWISFPLSHNSFPSFPFPPFPPHPIPSHSSPFTVGVAVISWSINCPKHIWNTLKQELMRWANFFSARLTLRTFGRSDPSLASLGEDTPGGKGENYTWGEYYAPGVT